MYFLPEQVAVYNRVRASVTEVEQLDLFVVDKASAIQWVRRELERRPMSFRDLQPEFTRELQSWMKYERTIELQELLRQNFLNYEGLAQVPEFNCILIFQQIIRICGTWTTEMLG